MHPVHVRVGHVRAWGQGIGDRHLDNFLLHQPTGRVVGIDFGHAFGSATYLLPVPELMGARIAPALRDKGRLSAAELEERAAGMRQRPLDSERVCSVYRAWCLEFL